MEVIFGIQINIKYLQMITAVVVVFISMLISIIENCIFYHCEFLCQK